VRRNISREQFAKFIFPWSRQEIWAVATDVHRFDDEHKDRIRERFRMYSGIPRFVLQSFFEDLKPLKSAFSITDILTTVNQVGSDIVNHPTVSEIILHMIPNEDLTKVSFQWASTLIMDTAFSMMFKLTKAKTECLLYGAISLHLGTFYGLLFEPYFHQKIYKARLQGQDS
jgi:hypothetical protein